MSTVDIGQDIILLRIQLQIAEMLMQRMLFLPTLFQTELPLNQIVLHLMELLSKMQTPLQVSQLVISRQTNLAIVEFHITSNEIPGY